MFKTDKRKRLENIGSWIIIAVILGVIMFNFIVEANAAEYVYHPEPIQAPPVVVEFKAELRVNGKEIDLGNFICPDPTIPKDFNPNACPPGYDCTVIPGKEARKLREDSMKKYTGSKMPWKLRNK